MCWIHLSVHVLGGEQAFAGTCASAGDSDATMIRKGGKIFTRPRSW
jgi:hypothetical protein